MRHLSLALTILALIACVVVAWAVVLRPAHHEVVVAPGKVDETAELQDPLQDLVSAPGIDNGPSRTEAPVVHSGEPAGSPGPRPELPQPGVVRVRVHDGASGQPLAGATVRFLGERRFAERTTDEAGLVECRLTPDVYRIGVHGNAHERTEVESVTVVSGDQQDLPRVLLWQGTSRVVGQLAVEGVRRDQPYLVELRGVGRNPCPECRARLAPDPADAAPQSRQPLVPERTCPHCGYDEEVSTWEVWPGGSFAFENLTSGSYRLLARRDRTAAADAEAVVPVEPATRHVVNLAAREAIAVEFELRDEDGNLFDGNWWEMPKEDAEGEAPKLRSATIQYRFFGTERRVAVARTAPAARPQAGDRGPQTVSLSFGNFSFGSMGNPDREDRPATEDDQLWPTSSAPDAPAAKLSIERLSDSRHRVLRVPCRRLELEVTCGPWRSERMPLDLEYAPPQTVVVTLQQGPGNQTLSAVIQGGGTMRLEGVTWDNLQLVLPDPDDG